MAGSAAPLFGTFAPSVQTRRAGSVPTQRAPADKQGWLQNLKSLGSVILLSESNKPQSLVIFKFLWLKTA